MFGLGVQEVVIILIIILLLFGGKKLPELGKGIGDSIRNIKDGSSDKKKDE
jgi:sec-independent protein translocase protein TatA